ncbi:hypothetical protein HanXRQr2_Chr01g0033021 [Helianthus annuus]|uniref:Uncharacterized protein n=1 Tax=Helianthus annuus TaxID=4232 RepID=A0A9K3JXH7_HELAN|nr:hypothetical protein HanXRQr2_Chr01g0033021 [Helianthus annuus]
MVNMRFNNKQIRRSKMTITCTHPSNQIDPSLPIFLISFQSNREKNVQLKP